jgi:hypothetical protein
MELIHWDTGLDRHCQVHGAFLQSPHLMTIQELCCVGSVAVLNTQQWTNLCLPV